MIEEELMKHGERGGLRRIERAGVALVGDVEGPVSFGFTERTGGVSRAPFASLNLGAHVDDDPAAVAENRRRVLAALGAESLSDRLVVPNQVHGDHVVMIADGSPAALEAARAEAAAGADAVVCTAPDVPVLLCFADCVPCILVAPRAFAVVHSGWKGTFAGIAGKAARVLMERARGQGGPRAHGARRMRPQRDCGLYRSPYPGRRIRGLGRAHGTLPHPVP